MIYLFAHPRFLRLRFKKIAFLGFMVSTFLLTTAPVLAQFAGGFNLQGELQNALEAIQGLGATGVLAFITLYVLATIAFLPGTILTLGAGVVFGVIQGSLWVMIGATLGAVLAFLTGRYLVRGWVVKRIESNTKFRAIDQAVGQKGFKIVLLTRLSPVFPFNLLNYAFGVTGVSLKDYFLGCVGMIPGTIMYVYLGSLTGNLAIVGSADQPTTPTVQWTVRIIGFLATLAVTLYVTRVARKALAEAVPMEAEPRSDLQP